MASMKILLVNPNRYKTPPVPPIGLEYLASSLEQNGHRIELADLCFSDNYLNEIDNAIGSFSPDLIGITVRNIDTVLYYNNEFFLDEIREVVSHIKKQHRKKIIIGGTGVLTNPEGVLAFLDADYAIAGQGEAVISNCLDAIMDPQNQQRIFTGGYNAENSCQRSRKGIDYRKYFDHGGIAGIETHKGCSSSCIYCIEANSRVIFKKSEVIASEIRDIADSGYRQFHICDSEFNEDLDFALEVCATIKETGGDMEWTTYMKPANYNRKLFREMKAAGASLITLSVDSWKKCPLYWTNTEQIVFNAKSAGIKMAVDLLTGFPYEQEDTLKWCLDFFRRIQPDSVGINTHIRLYKALQISRIVSADPKLRQYLIGCIDDASLMRPVFYNHILKERLEELMGNEPLFRIEGLAKGVNYTRLAALRS